MDCFVFDWEYRETSQWLRTFPDPKNMMMKKTGYTYVLSDNGRKALVCSNGIVKESKLEICHTLTDKGYYAIPGKGYYIASALVINRDKTEYVTLVVFEHQEMCYVDIEHEDRIINLAKRDNLIENYDWTMSKVLRALMRGGEVKQFIQVKSYHREFIRKVGRWFKGYEYDIDNVTLFLNRNDIPSCGWVSISGFAESANIMSHSTEYFVKSSMIKESTCTIEPRPLILSMDIESYTPRVGDFPRAMNDEDEIRMIGTTLRWYKSSESTRLAFASMGNLVLPTGLEKESWLVETFGGLKRVDFYRIKANDYDVLIFESERWMLVGYFHYVSTIKPHVIIGWNHLSYDYDYIACRFFCAKEDHVLFSRSKVWSHQWDYVQVENSAFGRDELVLIQGQGVINIDVMQYVRKYERYQQNSLKFVSSIELGDRGKIDLDYHEMFKLLGSSKIEDLLEVADYCIRDTDAPLDIFEKKETWLTVIELSKVLRVAPKNLTVKGSSAKIITQLHYHMNKSKFIVNAEENLHEMHAKYPGAYVFEPTPGLHSDVASLDFASLYPSIIIHDNICYTTWIRDKMPMEKHREVRVRFPGYIPSGLRSYMIKTREGLLLRFRWRSDRKGVVPSMIEELLSKRKYCKQQLKSSLESERIVWDRRQYAYKIAANSIYGVLGSRHKYLNLTSGAACVTSRGREHLQEAKMVVEKYGGKVVYGDTDSCFIHIPGCKDSDSYMRGTEQIRNEVAKMNNNVIQLAFENYFPKIILFGKKRYAAIKSDGSFYAKGISLVRKNKSSYATHTYQELLMCILSHPLGVYVVESYVKKKLFEVLGGQVDASQLSKRYKWNPQKVTSQTSTLHRHCESIGRNVLASNYMEYIPLLGHFKKTDTNASRVRDTEWMIKHKLPIDYLYYIENEMMKDIDELLEVVSLPKIVSAITVMVRLCITRRIIPNDVDDRVAKYIEYYINMSDEEVHKYRNYIASL